MKWDSLPSSDIIPLWVADMDFRTAPAITDALARRVASGIFGYTDVPPRYYDSIVDWFSRRHGWRPDKERIITTTGVVPAVSAVIKALTIPGDGVILQTPAYNCFFSSIRNNGCRQIDNPLLRIEKEDGFTYEMDFEQLEVLASDPRNKLLILCNPHNPSGRVWTREELDRVHSICLRNEVKVVSDEIHCELTHPGFKYTPYGSVDPHAVVCGSPSKAFNTAGLQNAFIVAPDISTMRKIDRAINDSEVCDVNPFGVDGVIAAYNDGEEWLEALKEYLEDNNRFLQSFIERNLPKWRICASEATYLAWIDIASTGMDGDAMEKLLMDKAKVKVSSGSIYGCPGYIRINYATRRSLLEEALQRIASTLIL